MRDDNKAFPHELAAAIDGGPKELDGYLELREGDDIIRDIKALTNYKTPVAVELRDYFAAAAMQGMAAEMVKGGYPRQDMLQGVPEQNLIAEVAYGISDAMLRERGRKPE